MKAALCALLLAPCSMLLSAEKAALVIGNSAYPDEAGGDYGDLPNAVRDARLMKTTLESVGFSVVYAEDATKSVMDEKLTEFENKISKGGTAVIYLAAHGIEFEKRNYILCSNAKGKARSRLGEESMEAETFAVAMLSAGASQSFLFLDCCREKPAAEWVTRGRSSGGLEDMKITGDIIISFAARPGENAQDQPLVSGAGVLKNNGPYAQALAKWIPAGVKHSEMFDNIRIEVDTLTSGQQRTWESGSILRPFFFAKGGSTAPPVQVAKMVPSVPTLPEPPATRSGTPATATKDAPFVNGLGMKFVPVLNYKDGKRVLFSIWETRRRDYAAYAVQNIGVDTEWEAQEYKGVPIGQETDHPVVSVSWADGKAFCAWLTKTEREGGRIGAQDEYRLPTDVEWSYAVGIGDKEDASASPEAKNAKIAAVYPWGGDFPPTGKVGNYADDAAKAKDTAFLGYIEGYNDGYARRAPVGSYPANRYGLYDLGGNVWEWCEDWYNAEQKHRVLRGGSWVDHVGDFLLSSGRLIRTPDYRSSDYGFRSVLVIGGVSP
ncbi:MAG: SUMF1/EgtB/PvdO family nonheme iron enzyme [Verrucomicrobiaceae bacterium]|nr:SUMF1/EgtB/PvdO family nonheme iron enzyme [Verrucomicrobiaceae bacterium]